MNLMKQKQRKSKAYCRRNKACYEHLRGDISGHLSNVFPSGLFIMECCFAAGGLVRACATDGLS